MFVTRPIQALIASVATLLCYGIADTRAELRQTPPALAAMVTAEVVERYAPATRYGIFRKGDRIGTHTLHFRGQDEGLDVQIESSIRVTVMKIPVFRFDYRASERWQGGRLVSVDAQVRENGDRQDVSLRNAGDSSLLQSATGETTHPRLEFSSNHWSPRVLASTRLFNTLTGEASKVSIRPIGRDELPAARTRAGSQVPALPYTRYRYSGDIDAESWYDDSGRWVGLVFSGEDGSRIEYRIEPDSR